MCVCVDPQVVAALLQISGPHSIMSLGNHLEIFSNNYILISIGRIRTSWNVQQRATLMASPPPPPLSIQQPPPPTPPVPPPSLSSSDLARISVSPFEPVSTLYLFLFPLWEKGWNYLGEKCDQLGYHIYVGGWVFVVFFFFSIVIISHVIRMSFNRQINNTVTHSFIHTVMQSKDADQNKCKCHNYRVVLNWWNI